MAVFVVAFVSRSENLFHNAFAYREVCVVQLINLFRIITERVQFVLQYCGTLAQHTFNNLDERISHSHTYTMSCLFTIILGELCGAQRLSSTPETSPRLVAKRAPRYDQDPSGSGSGGFSWSSVSIAEGRTNPLVATQPISLPFRVEHAGVLWYNQFRECFRVGSKRLLRHAIVSRLA